ncbi:CHC2 zinc finger domain-containing protein, partial [Helicobacter fennelliae]
MITPASLENLKNQLDIVEIVSHYIDLRRVGSNYAAR